MISSYVFADQANEKNCSIWNCYNPSVAINKLGNGNKSHLFHVSEFVQNGPEVQKAIEESDIIIVERNLFQDTMTMCAFWTVRNKSIIGIWDDAYDRMVDTNVSYSFWEHGEVKLQNDKGETKISYMLPPPLTQMKLTLKLLKGAQVVSKKLAEDWGKYTPTYHVNNYLNMDRYKNAERLYPHDDIFIYWGGSLSHLYSFQNSGVLKALQNITEKYLNVKVLISGDKRVFDALQLKPGKKLYSNFVPEEKFASLVKTATIGLAPLIGEYDERRSWIKCLEYQILKIPWIASDLCTYAELRDYGILVENTPEAWEYAIAETIDNLPKYQEKANTISYEFAKTQDIDLNIHKTLELYQKIIDGPYNI